MKSLRTRLAALVAVVAFLITGLAALAIAIERWQEESRSLPEAVNFSAVQLSEQGRLSDLNPEFPEGVDLFAVAFDENSETLARTGPLSDDLEESIVEDIWSLTTEEDVIVPAAYEIDGVEVFAAGVVCADADRCDTMVVGASVERLSAFLVDRLPWLIGAPVFVALAALVTARWVVARSLRPVDDMRRELEAITASDLDRRVPIPETGDELQHLGRAMNETIARLGSAVSANERFVADAAHELRSPITGVRAALEIEAARAPGSLIEDSARELDRASRLIEDLLVLARRQGGPTRRADVDLDDVVRAELAAARTRFPELDIQSTIAPARLSGDGDALRRVVANLVENACRYGDGKVEVVLAGDDRQRILTVDDDGPGISPVDRERVFERFARLDESRSRATGGSGLGLAIVQEIVADHGGTVEIEDSPLGGTRIRLLL